MTGINLVQIPARAICGATSGGLAKLPCKLSKFHYGPHNPYVDMPIRFRQFEKEGRS